MITKSNQLSTKFRYFLHRVLFTFTLSALLSLYALAQAPLHFETDVKRESIEFKMVKDLIIIPLMVNGKGPYNFVLDSGVGIFIITDSTLVTNLTNLRSIKITGLGEGRDADAWVTNSVSIGIGEQITGNVPAAILKKDAFDLSSYTGMPIHGLIGFEFFSSFIVKIDYDGKLITAYGNDKPYVLKNADKIPITIEEHKPYLNAEVGLPGEKIPVKLIIDSGAGHPISIESNEKHPFKIPEKNVPANLGVGLMGPIKGSVARISYLLLGKYILKNVISAFPTAKDVSDKVTTDRNGNLGNSILKRFLVVLDYSRGSMYLRPSSTFKEPFEHDMSGLELNAMGDNFDHLIITRVEPGSAGDDLGLQPEDELLSINFKAIRTFSLQEINDLFRSRNDRSFVLEIHPKEAKGNQRVILTLKRRI